MVTSLLLITMLLSLLKMKQFESCIKYILSRVGGGDERSVKAKRNILGSLVVKGLSIVTQLLLVPLTLNYVSSEIYGIWLTISSIIMWLGFFDVGLSLGLRNKLTEALALNENERGKVLVSTTYAMMLFIFIPLWIILEFAIPLVDWPSLLNINATYNDDVILAMRIIVACFCFQMIVHVLASVASAFQKVALASAFPVVGNMFSLLVIYILTKTCPPSLFVLALAISLVPVLVYLLFSVYYYSHDFSNVTPSIKKIDVSCIKTLFSLGYKFFLIQIQLIILYQTTNFLISYLSGPEEVTSYNIAYKYFGVGMMLFSIIISPFWPAFTDAYTKKDFLWMNGIYRKLSILFGGVLLLLLLMLLVSNLAYRLWIGDQVVVPVLMSVAVAIYMIFQSWFSLQIQLINGIGAINLQTIVTIICMSIHIPLSLFLGRYVGGIGVVLSMIFIAIIYCLVFTIQIRKLLSQKASGIWLK